MASIEDIISLVAHSQKIDKHKIKPQSDLCIDLGIDGDDFFEFIELFSKEFNVDMTGYRWYFHHCEEIGVTFGAMFFKPPYRRVTHIPITPLVLLEATNIGKWHIEYPEHYIPPRRYDIYINRNVALVLLFIGLYMLYLKYS